MTNSSIQQFLFNNFVGSNKSVEDDCGCFLEIERNSLEVRNAVFAIIRSYKPTTQTSFDGMISL